MSKYCIQCGNKLNEGEKFCSTCGQKANNSEPTFNNASNNGAPPSHQSNNNVPPPYAGSNNNVPPPPPPSSNNNYSKEEPYTEPSFNKTPPNVNPNKNNNQTYTKNVVQAKTSSKTILIIIATLVATLTIGSLGGFLYLKWKNFKQNTGSSTSTTATNNGSNNNSTTNTADNTDNNSATDTSNNNKNNSSSNNVLTDDMIKEYIALADSTCLNLFKLASEAEQNNQTKQPFASIRPLLQNCYCDALVDNTLKPFYETELGQWTYELGMAFPFYNKSYFEQCSFTVIQRTDSIVQVKIIDNNPEPLIYSVYTLKKYYKIWKIENIEMITND